ncbi:MAG: XRE family transcriptional regulator [Betaproteobacteria bacterium HGW-Betaproteobacteria-14]|nr:MAG: XRE family transcriptional regulator [Betaproteobacteria bacterium HGW-Betaproteobacteria-14]
MNPFACLLHETRTQCGLRQNELAEKMGYEKSYISSLEIGTKGPPTREFVEKLIATLGIEAEEQKLLYEVFEASQRKIVLDLDSPAEAYWMLKELRESIHTLHPVVIKTIRDLLQMQNLLQKHNIEPVRRLKKGRKEEARM